MEKEKVLEVEFKEIWGKYAWRIVKNNIPFDTNLSKAFNKEVKLVGNYKDNIYIFDNFEGIWDVLDEDTLIYEDDKIKIENFVKEINSKYGIPKRWRANKNDSYFIVTNFGDIVKLTEKYKQQDTLFYTLGNYFKTEELATKFRDTIWKDAFNKAKEFNTY